MRTHKYSAQKTTVHGITFPSKLEAAVFAILDLRVRAKELKDVKLQTSVLVKEKCPHCGEGPIRWKVDFSATDVKTGETVFIEAKGVETSDYKKRKRLWKANPPGRLEIWKGSWRNPQLTEVIE